jgi:hypothetical protein
MIESTDYSLRVKAWRAIPDSPGIIFYEHINNFVVSFTFPVPIKNKLVFFNSHSSLKFKAYTNLIADGLL